VRNEKLQRKGKIEKMRGEEREEQKRNFIKGINY
jgi:hypothetical protein